MKAMKAHNSLVLERVRMVQRLRESSGLESGYELEDVLETSNWIRRESGGKKSRGAEWCIAAGLIGLVCVACFGACM